MIAELGHFSLILALGMCVALAIIPTVGIVQKNTQLMNVSNSLAAGFFVFVAISFFCLGYAFWSDDFSVQYVALNSNSALPVQYKISAIWGGMKARSYCGHWLCLVGLLPLGRLAED